MKDLQHAARVFARRPGLYLLLGGLLALGIAATTVAFSFFEAVVLKPLPVHQPHELVRVVQRLPKVGSISSFPEAYYEAVRDQAETLAFTLGEAGEYYHFAMTSPAPARDISLRGVTPGFFQALGVQPLYGRVLSDEDEKRPSEIPPAVLSYRLWRERFAGDPDAVKGTTLAVNGRHFAIAGVMPEAFHGMTIDTGPDLWIPLAAYRTFSAVSADPVMFELAGRLEPGVSRSQAETDCRRIWQSTMRPYYRNVERRSEEDAARLVMRGVELEPLERGISILRDSFGGALRILLTSTILLLLIVCLNVGGILLVRTVARQQEFAVQLAVGASRLRLVRRVVAESLLLTVAAGGVGILIAWAAIPLARQVLPPIRDRSGSLLPLTLTVGIDWRIVLFVVGISLFAMLLFTVSPAIAVCRSGLDSLLRSARTIGGGARAPLIIGQVALCTMLLLVASLFVRTLQQLRNVDPGFDIDRIATFTADMGTHTGPDATAFLTTLRERVRALPGVESAAVSSVAIMRGRGMSWTVAPAGEPMTSAHFLGSSANNVSEEYFETMGLRMAQGRGFTPSDRAKTGPATATPSVVNQAFVARFFPTGDPIGRRFGTGVNGVAAAQYEIVGVVHDSKYRSLREPIPPVFYALRLPTDSFVLSVRTKADAQGIIDPVQKVLASIDPTLPFREVHTMREEVHNSIATERLLALVACSVGACAALFAAAGIYASLAYIAAQRRREIAIRMALGAERLHTAKVVATQTLAMVLAGIVLGLGGASVVASVVRSMLFDVSPQDAISLAGAVALVAALSAVATAIPVRRAMATVPAEALRDDN
jgi:predicted permease